MEAADPLLLAVAWAAITLFGISKAGFGGGFGVLAVPLMALVTSPAHAAALMLPSLLVMDAIGLVVFRQRFDAALLKLMLPAGLAGILLGTLVFRLIDAAGLKLILGTVSILFVLQRWLGTPHKPVAESRRERWSGRFWAMVSGFTSFVAHAGGPPISMYLIPKRLDHVIYVGTCAMFFAAVNAAKWVPYGLLGLFPSQTLQTGLVLALAAPFGYWLGLRVLKGLDGHLFYRLLNLALLLTGLKLVWDGLAG
ncbi:sulfite exporter TauE/SafE family protein [Pseudothauera rhizosphaerae]|uniref:Probable membrane transporter protein n=1 Tax=Pseudothauera rhizosphaerae TaxID=2565932 RepID=A0A4S4AQQ2_9RHOO|nr:sulfite exporter TauE/SafE family protein [Pseudothauera rhizosphaerae]THF62064.1 sulfite exporter TauE/SafE family protein [Pseudothauera rhizosphaerae]